MVKRFNWADHQCNRWCRTHYYFDFQQDQHVPFPGEWFILSSVHGWLGVTVFCGPGAWLPKRPTPAQWADMAMVCPHNPAQLTCNTCRRHEFRALPI